MNEVAKSGKTVLFVSHNLGLVKNLCGRGIFLDSGRIKISGEITSIINIYQQEFHYSYIKPIDNNYSDSLYLDKVYLLNSAGIKSNEINSGDSISIISKIQSKEKINNIRLRYEFKNHLNDLLFVCNNYFNQEIIDLTVGENNISCTIPDFPLNCGIYIIDVFIELNNIRFFKRLNAIKFEVITGNFYNSRIMPGRKFLFLTKQTWGKK